MHDKYRRRHNTQLETKSLAFDKTFVKAKKSESMTYGPTVGLTWVGARARDENPGTHIGYKQYHEAHVLTSDSNTHIWREWNMLQNREEKQVVKYGF